MCADNMRLGYAFKRPQITFQSQYKVKLDKYDRTVRESRLIGRLRPVHHFDRRRAGILTQSIGDADRPFRPFFANVDEERMFNYSM